MPATPLVVASIPTPSPAAAPTNLFELTAGTASDATNGHSFPNDSVTGLVVEGGTAGGTLTIVTNASLGGIAVGNVAFAVGTGSKRYIIPAAYFRDNAALFGNTIVVKGSVATILIKAVQGL